MKLVKENKNFERGLDPRDAMGIGQDDIRYAEFMIEKETELKEKNSLGAGPIWNWWESYSGDFWEDVGVNKISSADTDLERWKVAYNKDKERSLIQKRVVQRLLTLEEMPDDIDKWLWPGPNRRKGSR